MMIHKGQYYKCDADNLYILAATSPGTVCLINIGDGNRWGDSIGADNMLNISKDEWVKITKGMPESFTLAANNIEELGNG